jgi:hypothetical protein
MVFDACPPGRAAQAVPDRLEVRMGFVEKVAGNAGCLNGWDVAGGSRAEVHLCSLLDVVHSQGWVEMKRLRVPTPYQVVVRGRPVLV